MGKNNTFIISRDKVRLLEDLYDDGKLVVREGSEGVAIRARATISGEPIIRFDVGVFRVKPKKLVRI